MAESTNFSQLLFSEDDDVVGLDMGQSFNYSFSTSSGKPPKMLCFGSYQRSEGVCERETTKVPHKSGVTYNDSSSVSSGNNSSVNTVPKSTKRRYGPDQESVQGACSITTTSMATQITCKKTKAENSLTTGHAKVVRKEKLGERITALQQLVSPFGKTDTASVLHEAMGYIRFLHYQVQVLCSPYMQHAPVTEGGEKGVGSRAVLRSRGLCLVPVACTAHVANSNGADFWAPVMGHHVSSSSSSINN